MVKKIHKYSSSKRFVAGTMGALSVFALTTQANNIAEAKGKSASTGSTEQPASMSSSASAIRNNGQLSLAPIKSSSDASNDASAKSGLYVVKSGDTLSELAVHFNVSLNDLVAWNHIQNPNLIYVGQQLSVNGKNVASANTQSGMTLAQPQSFTVAGNAQQTTPQTSVASVQQAAPQQVVETPVNQSTAVQQGQASATSLAYTSSSNAAAYNSNASTSQQPQQASATAVTYQQQAAAVNTNSVSQAPVNSTANVQSSSSRPVAQQQQGEATNSAVATQQSQAQVQQSQAAPQTQQAAGQNNNVNLQSGSVVSLASKIASSNSVPYQWGGNTLNGMDCSGFVQYVYANAEGKQLPHNSTAMESYVNQKPVSQAQSGDLLFWGNHGSSYHVGIYMGNNQYAAAAKPGTNVAVYNLNSYFKPSFAGTVK